VNLLMGIDLGTSGLKTIVIEEKGKVLVEDKCSYSFDSPKSGYAEQDPDVWWNACKSTVTEVLNFCRSKDIAGLSFSGQMHGLVMLDSNYQSVRPAILHCDTRSTKQVEELQSIFGTEGVRILMMNAVYTGFLLPSLLWVKENEPQNYQKIHYVCLPKDFLKLKITGELSTDYSDASGTLAFDIKNLCWSEEILNRLSIDIEIFPKCYESTNRVGSVSAEAAKMTGLSADTPVMAGGGDQVMQGIGNGMINVGDATVNIGSSGQVSFQVDRPVLNSNLSTNTFCSYQRDRWLLLGATMTAGLSLKWWHQILGDVDYRQMDSEVAVIQPGSTGILFLPYLNGERTPHVDPNLSGMFLGINIGTSQAHMTRAVMEGITYSLMQAIEVCGELGFSASSLIASGGGARSQPWLQLQADIYNLPIRVGTFEEQAGLGAAIVAGVGAGVYSDLEEGCRTAVRHRGNIIYPDIANHRIYQEYYELYKEAYFSNKLLLNKITKMSRGNISCTHS
jgi:xylulokinase